MTVIKIGGSLFDVPKLGDRVAKFVADCRFSCPLLLAGGGGFADVVRTLDDCHHLPEAVSHQLGVRSLSLSARLLVALSDEFRLITQLSEAQPIWESGFVPVLNPVQAVLATKQFPPSWDVTSDSIAAWIATQTVDSHLILLKSVPLPENWSSQHAAEKGLVDSYFPKLATQLERLEWCNFREPHPTVQPWMATAGKTPAVVDDAVQDGVRQ